MESRVTLAEEAEIDATFKRGDEEINVSRLKRRAKEHLIELAYRRYYRKMIVEKDPSELPQDLQLALKDLPRSLFETAKSDPNHITRMWICINPKEADPKQLLKAMKRCVAKAMLRTTTHHWVMEQRAVEGESPRGWHFHWLADFETPRFKGIYCQQIVQAFKKFLDPDNDRAVQLYPIYDDAGWDNRMSYISGIKKGDAATKMPKVAYDFKCRDALGIPHLFSYP